MSTIRIAVVGAGFMGGTHARAYHAMDGVEIAAIVASTPNRAEALATELGTTWTDDYAAVLADGTVDAVDICVPTPDHRAATEAALAAGKHVLLEKPLALTKADAEAIAAADASDRVVMVAHVLRFWPEYVELKRIVDSGELGAPLSVNAVRRQPAPNWTDGGPRGHLTGGSLHDMLIHDFDAANWLLGRPASVTATGIYNPANDAVDQGQVLVRYGEGRSATIDGGSMMPESYPFTSRFEVLCERGAVEYHFRAGGRSFEVGEPTNTLTVYRNEGDPEVVEVEQTDPYANECAYFIDCVRTGTKPERSTPAAAMDAMLVSLAAQASVDRGEAVAIDAV